MKYRMDKQFADPASGLSNKFSNIGNKRRWLCWPYCHHLALALAMLTTLNACIPLREPGTNPPSTADKPTVKASASTETITAGLSVTLSAQVTGGDLPFLFRWDLNSGPASVDLGVQDTNSPSLDTPGLLTIGRYVFRVTVTDAAARIGTGFVTVEVTAAITLSTNATSRDVFEGTPVTIEVAVQSENQPVQFVWSFIDGPAELDLSDQTSATLTTPSLPEPGTYLFRLTATDSLGVEDTLTVTVVAAQSLTAEAPPLAVIDQPIAVSASFDSAAAGASVLWEVVQGTASFDDSSSLTPMLTTSAAETVIIRITATIPSDGANPAVATRELEIVSVADLSPQVSIETIFGNLIMELNGELAPLHAANFLLYTDDGFYDGLLIHRIACKDDQQAAVCDPFVIQGGGFERIDGELTLKDPTRDPIMSEARPELSNSVVNSVALALTGGNPNSGATQFFVNLSDNDFLDSQGFTAFGMIVGGFDVLDQLLTLPREENPFAPPGEFSLPTDDVIIETVRRLNP